MLRRISLSKDTWISNKRCADRGYFTGSNHGYDEVLELFKYEEYAGTYDFTFAKILFQYDEEKISDLNIPDGTAVKYELCLYDITHDSTLPSSYDLDCYPLMSQSWDEGKGIDDEGKDDGYANWFSASSTSEWFQSGAFDEYSGNLSASMRFDTGWEDYKPDFSDVLSYHLSGNTNYGCIIKLKNAHEDDSNQYYRKSFYSRHAKDVAKRPYIEARYDDSKYDDRKNVWKDESSRLWLRRVVNGQTKNFDRDKVDNIYVKVQDVVSGNATYETHFTSTFDSTLTGSYYVDVTIDSTGSYSGSAWHDIWYSGSTIFYSGTFELHEPSTNSGTVINNIVATMPNLKNVYRYEEKARMRVVLEDTENYQDAILSASYDQKQIYSKKMWWGIVDDITNEEIIPFATGSDNGTLMSYDAQGHYTTLHMNTFTRGYAYRIRLYLEHNDEIKVLDDDCWRFKVV